MNPDSRHSVGHSKLEGCSKRLVGRADDKTCSLIKSIVLTLRTTTFLDCSITL
jgi:hypothetical protein